jgi:hypothetical protein
LIHLLGDLFNVRLTDSAAFANHHLCLIIASIIYLLVDAFVLFLTNVVQESYKRKTKGKNQGKKKNPILIMVMMMAKLFACPTQECDMNQSIS